MMVNSLYVCDLFEKILNFKFFRNLFLIVVLLGYMVNNLKKDLEIFYEKTIFALLNYLSFTFECM